MIVNAYLDTTRQQRGDLPQVVEDAYRAIYSNILKTRLAPAHRASAPELKVISTLNKKAESVGFPTGRYIIFDHYLGETIDDLTEIFYSATDTDEAFAYAFRLMSEAAACWGETDLSFYFSLLYSIAYHNTDPRRTPELASISNERKYSVMIQETYILAHEVAHFVWAVHPSDTTAFNNLIRALLASIPTAAPEAAVERYLDSFTFQIRGEAVPFASLARPGEDRLGDELRTVLHEQAVEAGDIRQKLLGDLPSSCGVREEIFADIFAVETCLRLYAGTFDSETLLSAIIMALENVVTIGLTTELLDHLLGGSPKTDGQIVHMRAQIVSVYLESWAHDNLPEGALAASLTLKNTFTRYTRFIRDPMLLMAASKVVKAEIPSKATLRETREAIQKEYPGATPDFLIRNRPYT